MAGTPVTHKIVLTASAIQEWKDGDYTNAGFCCVNAPGYTVSKAFKSTEDTLTNLPWYLEIEYTPPAATPSNGMLPMLGCGS